MFQRCVLTQQLMVVLALRFLGGSCAQKCPIALKAHTKKSKPPASTLFEVRTALLWSFFCPVLSQRLFSGGEGSRKPCGAWTAKPEAMLRSQSKPVVPQARHLESPRFHFLHSNAEEMVSGSVKSEQTVCKTPASVSLTASPRQLTSTLHLLRSDWPRV